MRFAGSSHLRDSGIGQGSNLTETGSYWGLVTVAAASVLLKFRSGSAAVLLLLLGLPAKPRDSTFWKPNPQKIKGTTQQLGSITRLVSSACLIYRESYCDMHARTLPQLAQWHLASVTLHGGVTINLFWPFQLVFVHVWRTKAIHTL